MPRRVGKDVFDVNRKALIDQPSQALMPPLSGLLPKVIDGPPPLPVSEAASESMGAKALVRVAPDRPEGSHGHPSPKPRGVGGRPSPEMREEGRITPVATRIPGPLYEAALPLVKGVGKPSWGQLIAWTCQDHEREVRSEVDAIAKVVSMPRRLRGQNREGEATMQVTARLLPAELDVLDKLRAALDEIGDPQVTRTMVVVAALTVATRE